MSSNVVTSTEYGQYSLIYTDSVFLNRRAAARYRALASIIPGR